MRERVYVCAAKRLLAVPVRCVLVVDRLILCAHTNGWAWAWVSRGACLQALTLLRFQGVIAGGNLGLQKLALGAQREQTQR